MKWSGICPYFSFAYVFVRVYTRSLYQQPVQQLSVLLYVFVLRIHIQYMYGPIYAWSGGGRQKVIVRGTEKEYDSYANPKLKSMHCSDISCWIMFLVCAFEHLNYEIFSFYRVTFSRQQKISKALLKIMMIFWAIFHEFVVENNVFFYLNWNFSDKVKRPNVFFSLSLDSINVTEWKWFVLCKSNQQKWNRKLTDYGGQ